MALVASQFTPLSDLKPFKTQWKIHVKLLHVYKQYSTKAGETIEMVFADESGTKISATVKREHTKKYQRSLVEGSWKIISNISINPCTGMYKVSDLVYRIAFLYTTTVVPSEYRNDDLFLTAPPYDQILAGDLDLTVLVDVIGQVIDCGDVREIMTHNRANKKLDFNLKDIEGNILACTLWGKFGDSMSQVVKQANGGIVLCLIRFAKINYYQDAFNISNAFDVSKVYTDPTLSVLAAFCGNLPENRKELAVLDLGKKRVSANANEERFLKFPRHTIAELHAETEVGKCRTICTVYAIDTDWPWYYFGCQKCNKKVVIEEPIKLENSKVAMKPKYWCEVCNSYAKTVVPKFWLHLDIMDQTSETKCMLFDSFVADMLGTTAAVVLNGETQEIEDPTVLPDIITDLCGKTFQFLLCHQKENVTNGYRTYNVAYIWSGNKLQEHIMLEESENNIDWSLNISGEPSLMITNGESHIETDISSSITPVSSKRKSGDVGDQSDQNSTTKTKLNPVVLIDDSPKDNSSDGKELTIGDDLGTI